MPSRGTEAFWAGRTSTVGVGHKIRCHNGIESSELGTNMCCAAIVDRVVRNTSKLRRSWDSRIGRASTGVGVHAASIVERR